MKSERAGNNLRICRKCLLRDADPLAYKRDLEEYIERLGNDIRTDQDEYKRRLDICLSCDRLERGTCLSCGCYVELRAAAITAHCPKKKW